MPRKEQLLGTPCHCRSYLSALKLSDLHQAGQRLTLVVYTVPLSASLPRPLSDMQRALSGEVYSTLPARLAGCSLAATPLLPSMLLLSAARGSLQRAARYLQGRAAAQQQQKVSTILQNKRNSSNDLHIHPGHAKCLPTHHTLVTNCIQIQLCSSTPIECCRHAAVPFPCTHVAPGDL
jgi:hypothetical protein